MKPTFLKRLLKNIALAMLVSGLSGCFISPGNFSSYVVVKNDGTFDFNYKGEIFFVGMSGLAKVDEETTVETDKENWNIENTNQKKHSDKTTDDIADLIGGIDPSDPQAEEKFIALLLSHNGWKKVEAVGDGLFEVEFAVSGNLTHDFRFPVIENAFIDQPFVEIILKDDGIVNINALGFSMQEETNPASAILAGLMSIASFEQLEDLDNLSIPDMSGTFEVFTDGEILTSNHEREHSREGYGLGRVWTVNKNTIAAPRAKIKLSSLNS